MKLHTNALTEQGIQAALNRARDKGKVAGDIHFVTFEVQGSRSHRQGYEIQLGTYDKTSGPTTSRRYKNSGQYGAGDMYAATYDEWGWFIAEIYAEDPNAKFGPYDDAGDFDAKTQFKYGY